jgi:hypothetical protein
MAAQPGMDEEPLYPSEPGRLDDMAGAQALSMKAQTWTGRQTGSSSSANWASREVEYGDAPSSTMVQLYGVVKAPLTGKAPQTGEHAKRIVDERQAGA